MHEKLLTLLPDDMPIHVEMGEPAPSVALDLIELELPPPPPPPPPP